MPRLLICAAVCLLAVAPADAAAELSIERLFASPELSGPSLRQAELSPAGDRVTFIRARDEDRDLLDLWEYHIADGETRILVAADAVLADEGELSPEEQARRERARIAGLRGIVEYRWSGDGRFLIFPLGGNIYLLDLAADEAEVRQITDSEAFDIDPQVSPDGRFVAFVRERNLWLADIETGTPRQLTDDGDELIANGLADFIAAEEMGRSTGFWWSPDSRHIAFLRTDESQIEPTLRFEILADQITMIEQRYPFAGTPNVVNHLGVIAVDDAASENPIRWIDLGPERDIYIPRVAWLPDGTRLSFQRQSRDQKTLELLIARLDDSAPELILTETAETWVELHDDLHFLSGVPGFIWSSERSGYRHLYLYDLTGKQIRALTAGNWAVDELVGVDEDLGLVYFMAAEVSPREKHLYRQSLVTATPAEVTRLSRRAGWHEVKMDRSARIYVKTFSNTRQPPQLSLHSTDGERIAWLLENRLSEDHPYAPFRAGHRPTEFGSLVGPQGFELHYRLIRPANFDPSRRYPVFVHVYGGPTHRLVTDRWTRRTLLDQYFARQGYVVFSLDNRGIVRQGKALHDEIYLRMGQVEVEDQMLGVEWLKSQDFVDAERIGIFGWSYGGYIALMALAQHPGTFAAGVAVAPVTDWALYDTHYTERYLGRPQDQPEAYAQGNVLSWADRINDPLLLVHPMADDNVLFTHSTMLMQKLQEERIPFDLMTYPGERHGITGAAQRVHVHEMIDRFFRLHLNPDS
ncbi:MAG: alpha/beta fold hydrolase [Wenzhouxiangella sp.]